MELLAAILVLMGVAGSVLPLLPGPPVSYLGLLIYANSRGLSDIGSTGLVIFGVLTILSIIFDYIAPFLGAKKYKASKYGRAGSLIGTFLGIMTFGPFGILMGPVIGGFVGEYIYKKDIKVALKSALGSFMGFVAGTIFGFLISLFITIYFFYLLLA